MKGLPKDLVEYLQSGGQFAYDPSHCECGCVKLKSYPELEEGMVWIEGVVNAKRGYYEIPAVSLLIDCEHYDPEYLLLWLQNEKKFGT